MMLCVIELTVANALILLEESILMEGFATDILGLHNCYQKCMYIICIAGYLLHVPVRHRNTLKEILQWWIANDQQPSWDKLISKVIACNDRVKANATTYENLSTFIRYVVLPVHIS